jgi:hypothetical protein
VERLRRVGLWVSKRVATWVSRNELFERMGERAAQSPLADEAWSAPSAKRAAAKKEKK